MYIFMVLTLHIMVAAVFGVVVVAAGTYCNYSKCVANLWLFCWMILMCVHW